MAINKIFFSGFIGFFLISSNITIINASEKKDAEAARRFAAAVMGSYNNSNNEYSRFLKDNGEMKSMSEIASDSLVVGVGKGISNTTTKTIENGFDFIPSFFKRLGILTAAFVYKLAYGSRGLNFDFIALNYESIRKVVDPYSKKTYASNDRVKRMNEIDQAMNNEIRDPNWEKMQNKILNLINNLQANLTKSLPCYNLKYSNVGMIRRSLASIVYMLSTQDNEQISRYIVSTINDLDTLKDYISSFKSQKEVEQNTEHIHKWLQIVLLDLQQLGNLINGDEMNKASFAAPTRPNIQGANLGDLLTGVVG